MPKRLFKLRIFCGLAAFLLAVSSRADEAPRFIGAPERIQGSGWRLTWESIAGREYRVDSSANLTTWTEGIGRVTAAGGTASFTDPDLTTFPKRFWRVVLLPASGDTDAPIVGTVSARVQLVDDIPVLVVRVDAQDANGVVGVLYLDSGGAALGEASLDPADALWKLTQPAPGDSFEVLGLKARARDAAGNLGESPLGRFTLFDPSRFAALDGDGNPVRGAPVPVDANGKLGPFEFRIGGGGALGAGGDLVLTFPDGASISGSGADRQLVFTRVRAAFGKDSPFVLNVPATVDGPPRNLPLLGSISVARVASALMLPEGSGLPLTLFGLFDLRLDAGDFSPEGLLAPVLAPVGELLKGLPAITSAYAAHLLDFSDPARLRLPVSGQIELPDGSAQPPLLRVDPASPLWLEFRADGGVSLSGGAELAIPESGLRIRVRVRIDDPEYHLQVEADDLLFSALAPLAGLLPTPPASVNTGALDAETARLLALARSYREFAAAAAVARPVPADTAGTGPASPPDAGSLVSGLLDAWTSGAAAGLSGSLSGPQIQALRAFAAQVARSGSGASDLRSSLEYLEAVARARADASLSTLHPDFDAALAELESAAGARSLEPFAVASFEDLKVTLVKLLDVRALYQLIGREEPENLEVRIERLLRQFILDFVATHGVAPGQFSPAPGSVIAGMNRFVAMQRMREMVDLLALTQLLGLDDTLGDFSRYDAPVGEFLSQLGVRLGTVLNGALTGAEVAKDYRAFLYATEDLIEVIAVRQRGLFPDAAAGALDAAGVPDGIPAALGTRMEAVFLADLAKPVEERSWVDVSGELSRLLGILENVDGAGSGLSFPAGPFVRAFNRLEILLASATTPAALASENRPVVLVSLVRAGSLHDRLQRRFEGAPGLVSGVRWDNVRLPAVVARLRVVCESSLAFTELHDAARALVSEADTLRLEAGLPGANGSDLAIRRARYLNQAAEVLAGSFSVVSGVWDAALAARSAAGPGAQDLLLPGEVRVLQPWGSVRYNRLSGNLAGSIGGSVELPGLAGGTRLDILGLSLSNRGEFDLSAAGSVQGIPMGSLNGTLDVPSRRPLRVKHREGVPLEVAGSAKLTLSNGLQFEGYIDFADPLYKFGLAAGGLRFDLADRLVADLPPRLNFDGAGPAVLEAWANYFQQLGAAVEPLADLAAQPLIGQPRRRPEFSNPVVQFQYADVGAWATAVATDASLMGSEPTARFLGFVREHLSNARRGLAEASAGLELQRKLAEVRELNRNLRRVAEAYASAGQGGVLENDPDFLQYADELLVSALDLLADPLSSATPEGARLAAKTALEIDALRALVGLEGGVVGSPDLQNVLLVALGSRMEQHGLGAQTGQVVNAPLFDSKSRAELVVLLREITDFEGDLQLVGADTDVRFRRAAFEIVQRVRGLTAAELSLTPAANWPRRMELMADLRFLAAAVDLGLTDDDAGLRSQLLTDLLGAEAGIPAMIEAIRSGSVYRADQRFYGIWSDTRDAIRRFGGQPGTLGQASSDYVRKELEFDSELLGDLLRALPNSANLDFGQPLAKLLEVLPAAQDLLGEQDPVTQSARTLLLTATVEIAGVAAAQESWWDITEYIRLLNEGLSKRPNLVGTATGDAILAASRATSALAGQLLAALTPRIEPERPLDLRLPGDLVVRRISGDFLYRRATTSPAQAAVFTGTLAGLFEFPEAKADGKPLRLSGRGTLSGNGAFSFDIAARNIALRGDDLILDLDAQVSASAAGQIVVGSAGAGVVLRQRNPRPSANPEFYTYSGSIAWQPGLLTLSGATNQPLDFDRDLVLFGSSFSARFEGQEDGRFGVGGTLALWAQPRDLPPAGPSTSDYQLVFSGAETVFAYDEAGFSLTLARLASEPELKLAIAPGLLAGFVTPVDCSAAGTFPNDPLSANPVEVIFSGNASFGLRFDYGAPGAFGTLHFVSTPPESITLQNFGFALPGAPDFRFAVCNATLELPGPGEQLPRLSAFSARLQVPLPAPEGASRTTVVRLDGSDWGLDGLPFGDALVGLAEAGELFAENGFTVELAPNPGSNPGLGLRIESEQQGSETLTTAALVGLIRIRFSGSLLVDELSGQDFAAGAGGEIGLSVRTAQDGSVLSVLPVFTLTTLQAQAKLRLGSPQFLRIRGPGTAPADLATLTLVGLQNLTDLAPDRTFSVEFSGIGELPDLLAFTLNEARLTFAGAGGVRFFVNEASVAALEGQSLFQIGEGEFMPLRVNSIGFGLFNDLPVDGGAFAPENIKLILSGSLRLNVPGFDDPGTTGGPPVPSIEGDVQNLTLGFPSGFLQPPSIAATGVRLALRNLTIGDLAGITGSVGLANLDDPSRLIIAGEAGADFNGVGVKLLIAAGFDGLIGICIKANAGPAGIPLDGGALGGILLTGAAGGVKFRGGFGDPCEFSSYLNFGADGSPSFNPPEDNPDSGADDSPSFNPSENNLASGEDTPVPVSAYVGLTWEELAGLDHDKVPVELQREFLALAQEDTEAGAEAPASEDILTTPCPPTPAPDEENDAATIKLSGTFSHAAVSTVLNVTGGVLASTDGTACMEGTLNLIGIPVGQSNLCFSLNPDALGIPNPQLCGSAFLGFGPLELGSLNLLLSCPDCVTGVIDALGSFAIGVAALPELEDFIFDAIDETSGFQIAADGSLVARAPVDRQRPVSDYLGPVQLVDTPGVRLDVQGQVAVMTRLLNLEKLGAVGQSGFEASVIEKAKDLMFELNSAVAPQFTFGGSVGPRLFGFPLTGADLLEVNASFGRVTDGQGAAFDQFGANLSFSPSWFFLNQGFLAVGMSPMLPGIDQAELGFSVLSPTVTREEIDLLFEGPEGVAEFAEGRAGAFLDGALLTFGYELSPFGVRLGNGQARIVFPRIAQHPLNPDREGGDWNASTRPPLVTNASRLSRSDLLLLAAERDLLRDATWRGRPGELGALVSGLGSLPDGTSVPTGLETALATQDLVRDYFPHGGILAASSLSFPAFIAEAPPLDQLATIFQIPADQAAFDTWWQALSTVWTDYVTGTTEIGSAALYVPAPNPPGLWTAGGNAEPAATDFLAALGAPDLNAILALTGDARRALYPVDEFLLRGYAEPRFLGLPVARADINADGDGLLLTASVDTGSWLDRLRPGTLAPEAAFDLTFRIGEPRSQTAARGTLPSSPAEANGPDASQVFASVNASINPANAQTLTNALLDSLPRVSLETNVGLLVPAELESFLSLSGSADLRLFAFSFGFDPLYNPLLDEFYPLNKASFSEASPDPYTVARRQGGAGITGALNFQGPGFVLSNITTAVSLSVGGADALFPRAKARFEVDEFSVGDDFSFSGMVDFDSDPAIGGNYYSVAGEMTPLDIAPFLVVRSAVDALGQPRDLAQPIASDERIGAELRVVRAAGLPTTEVVIPPAVVYSPLLGAVGAIHGASPEDPFTFSSVEETPWAATLVFGNTLTLRDPATLVIDPANPLNVSGNILLQATFGGGAPGEGIGATVEGRGLEEITLRVAIPLGAKLTLFPGQTTEASFTVGANATSCLFMVIGRNAHSGMPELRQLYYDTGTVTLDLAQTAPDAQGVRTPLIRATGRLEFGYEPLTLSGQMGPTQASVPFGTVAVDAVNEKIVSVSNTGSGLLVVDASVLSGIERFQVDPARLMLLPGAQGDFTVTQQSTVPGAASGVLRLSASQGADPVRDIALSASATATGVLNLSQASLGFGSVVRGESRELSFAISNLGRGPLTVNSVTVGGFFSVVRPAFPLTLEPLASQTVVVRFSPPATGSTTSQTVTVNTSAGSGTLNATGSTAERFWYRVSEGGAALRSVAYANPASGPFLMAVGNAGTVLTSISKGNSWVPMQLPGTGDLNHVTLNTALTRGILTGESSIHVLNASGGPWIEIPEFKEAKRLRPAGAWKAGAHHAVNGRFVAAGKGTNGLGLIAVSTTNINEEWQGVTQTSQSTLKPLNHVVFVPTLNAFVAVGDEREYVQSFDGVSWNPVSVGYPAGVSATARLNAIATNYDTVSAASRVWLAVGDNGLILHRFDTNSNWTVITPPTAAVGVNFRSVTISGTAAQIVGDNGVILRSSSSGSSWALETTEAPRSLFGIAAMGNTTEYVAVGNQGDIHVRDELRATSLRGAVHLPQPLQFTTRSGGRTYRHFTLKNPSARALTYVLGAPAGITLDAADVTLNAGEARNVLVEYDASTAAGASGDITISQSSVVQARIPVSITERTHGWRRLAYPGGKAGETSVRTLTAFGGGSVWMATEEELYRSTNSGSSWTRILTSGSGGFSEGHVADSVRGLFPTFQTNDAHILRGSLPPPLVNRNSSLPVQRLHTEMRTVVSTSRLHGVQILSDGSVSQFADNGISLSFTTVTPPAGTVPVDVAHRGNIFLLSRNALHSKTIGGTAWTERFSSANTLRDLDFQSSTHAWAVADQGDIYTSVDSGLTWTKAISNNAPNLQRISFGSTTNGWGIDRDASGRQRIMFTSDAGLNWTEELSLRPDPSIGTLTHIQALSSTSALVGGTNRELWQRFSLAAANPSYLYAPAQVRFPMVPLNERGSVQVQVRNPGGTSLVLNEALMNEAAGEFSTSFQGPLTIAAGGTANIEVVFRPRATGNKRGVLRLISNASNGFIDIELLGNSEIGRSVIVVDTVPAGLPWRVVGEASFGTAPRVFRVVADPSNSVQWKRSSDIEIEAAASATLAGNTYAFRTWPGSNDRILSYRVPLAGNDQLVARFERERPVPPVHTAPPSIPANPCGTIGVPPGVGPGPVVPDHRRLARNARTRCRRALPHGGGALLQPDPRTGQPAQQCLGDPAARRQRGVTRGPGGLLALQRGERSGRGGDRGAGTARVRQARGARRTPASFRRCGCEPRHRLCQRGTPAARGSAAAAVCR
jgi:photosystem II stability/assembly factor-like uncharacterized protein